MQVATYPGGVQTTLRGPAQRAAGERSGGAFDSGVHQLCCGKSPCRIKIKFILFSQTKENTMTTFEFKMTPRAYYAGWRVLQRQQLRLQWVFCALCEVLAAAGILLYFLLQDVAETAMLPALSGIVAAMAVLLPWMRRSSVLREFGNSPTLTQPLPSGWRSRRCWCGANLSSTPCPAGDHLRQRDQGLYYSHRVLPNGAVCN